VDLPRFKHAIAAEQANVLPLFEAEFAQRALATEHQEQFARQTKWLHMLRIVGEYSAKAQKKLIIWPGEFPSIDAPRVDDALRLRWTARDQRMFLSKRERRAHVHYDMNGCIDDPQLAHDKYRARVCWTDEEKTIFVEKYRLHQTAFRKIKAALHDKSYKEVIGIYYLNKYPLNLRDREGGKRRGKKKVVSERVAKRSS
jgi:hypothetical protein